MGNFFELGRYEQISGGSNGTCQINAVGIPTTIQAGMSFVLSSFTGLPRFHRQVNEIPVSRSKSDATNDFLCLNLFMIPDVLAPMAMRNLAGFVGTRVNK